MICVILHEAPAVCVMAGQESNDRGPTHVFLLLQQVGLAGFNPFVDRRDVSPDLGISPGQWLIY
jgi:hypothetical protein